MGGEGRHCYVGADSDKLDGLEVVPHLVRAVSEVVAAVARSELTKVVSPEAPGGVRSFVGGCLLFVG